MTPQVLFEVARNSVIVTEHLRHWKQGDIPTFEAMLIQTIDALVYHNRILIDTAVANRERSPFEPIKAPSEGATMAEINIRRRKAVRDDYQRHVEEMLKVMTEANRPKETT